jgi:hypothetical protein
MFTMMYTMPSSGIHIADQLLSVPMRLKSTSTVPKTFSCLGFISPAYPVLVWGLEKPGF